MLNITNNTKDTLVQVTGATLSGEVISIQAKKTVKVDESTLVEDHLNIFNIFGNSLTVVKETPQPKKEVIEKKPEPKAAVSDKEKQSDSK